MARRIVSIAMYTLVVGMSLLMRDLAAQPDVRHLPARAQSALVAGSMLFDIPAQPLQAALDAYNEQTGYSGLYSASAVQGLFSTQVSGSYTADAALRVLLEGSGLAATFTAADAFVLEAQIKTTQGKQESHTYPALLQSGVRDAFCREPLLAALDFRIALRFYVDVKGRVTQALLLDSSGNKARDSAILQALKKVDIGRGPSDLSLPFFMLILPQQLAASGDCPAVTRH
ncbi:secretin and TonB N-terminal domain-containing protein [Herminiimonas sp. KBW02]|uniref:secretin and TonB N-terminal domain-containing protein n=1 Tax=Herminiimonas sp. KBW02 TaxID=2153363 RepID=UPI001F1AB1FA|nr:secretin and TonB N-terminal domain-containing protein [Herminiimonas sp. KBW02]